MKTKFLLAVLMVVFVSIGANAKSLRETAFNDRASINNGVKSGVVIPPHRVHHVRRGHVYVIHHRPMHHRMYRKHVRHEHRMVGGTHVYKTKYKTRRW